MGTSDTPSSIKVYWKVESALVEGWKWLPNSTLEVCFFYLVHCDISFIQTHAWWICVTFLAWCQVDHIMHLWTGEEPPIQMHQCPLPGRGTKFRGTKFVFAGSSSDSGTGLMAASLWDIACCDTSGTVVVEWLSCVACSIDSLSLLVSLEDMLLWIADSPATCWHLTQLDKSFWYMQLSATRANSGAAKGWIW